jgi:hypothetical protein
MSFDQANNTLFYYVKNIFKDNLIKHTYYLKVDYTCIPEKISYIKWP